LSSESPFTDSERTVWKKMMAEIYHQFVSKAAEGRKMDATRLEQLAGGRIWTGRQAKENGLVDELGTLRDAVDAAKKMAGLAPGEKTELLILPQPRSIFDQLFGADVALESRVLEKLTGMRPELRRALRQAELLGRIAIEPVLTVLPYQVNLR
jgi:protease-4